MPVLDATDLQAISDELAGDSGFLAAIAAQVAASAVASVTGNVGGNVNGSVGSVDANVTAVLADTSHGGGNAVLTLSTFETTNFTVNAIAVLSNLATAMEEDGPGVYRFTENALEEAPSGGSLTAQQVWEYATRTLTAFAFTVTTGNTYQAKVGLIDADGASVDRYTVVWFKNGEPVTSGITSPTIQVFDSAGTDLIGVTALTEIGSSGTYRYNASAAERITAGTAYLAKVQATIDASTRSWFQWIGRDS